jgi:hypothetical protein
LVEHIEVLCTPREKRRLYRDEHGSQNPQILYRWDCPVSGARVGSSDEKEARKDMLAHDCGGSGWCPIPRPGAGRAAPEGQLGLFDPSSK